MFIIPDQIDGLVQDSGNSIANALELLTLSYRNMISGSNKMQKLSFGDMIEYPVAKLK